MNSKDVVPKMFKGCPEPWLTGVCHRGGVLHLSAATYPLQKCEPLGLIRIQRL